MKKLAFNPYLPEWEHIPDGEPRVFGDRVYIYGSHDEDGGDEFCLLDYVCWSAPVDDLGNWRYEGVIYRKEQEPLQKDASIPGHSRSGCRRPASSPVCSGCRPGQGQPILFILFHGFFQRYFRSGRRPPGRAVFISGSCEAGRWHITPGYTLV